jgi:hypothetical protein
MGKSAEVIDGKGIAMAPLSKRVWKFLEIKEIYRKGRKQKSERSKAGSKEGGRTGWRGFCPAWRRQTMQ